MHAARHHRHSFARLGALATFALAAWWVTLAAQPPEVEDPGGKIKKRIVVDDPEPRPRVQGGGTGNPPNVRLDELVIAAEQAKLPAIRDTLLKYAVPFDRLSDNKGGVNRIKPIPLHRDDTFPKEFGIADLNADGSPRDFRQVSLAEVKRFDFFEELALAEADLLLKMKPLGSGTAPEGLTADVQMAVAEKLLTAALRYHDFARDSTPPIRSGKTWDKVRKQLVERLRKVRVDGLDRATTAGDWNAARELGTKLLASYPNDPEIIRSVAVARVTEAELLVKSKTHSDKVRARELLDEIIPKLPGNTGDRARQMRKELAAEAVRLYERATLLQKNGNLLEARKDAEAAYDLDPSLPKLRDLLRDLGAGYAVLHVGVRRFPEQMSPATARFDSERQAVELLFEGLLEELPEEIPDGRGGVTLGGVRYRPAAGLGAPLVVSGGRDLLMRQFEGDGGFTVHDVVETVRLLQTHPELWVSAGLPWLQGLPAPGTGGTLRVEFRHGHPDPRSLLTFKILPGRMLAQKNRTLDDPEFALKPFGGGPYRTHAVTKVTGYDNREMIFVDNPDYRRWKDREGLPRSREVRLIEFPATTEPGDVKKYLDPLSAFRDGRLHLIPDLTPDEVKKFLTQGNEFSGKGRMVATANTRRVNILAVNHRRPAFQSRDLRRGIAHAIDREAILNELNGDLRAEYRRISAPMSGPYPPTSWATAKGPGGVVVPLLNRGEAQVRLRRYLNAPGARVDFSLSFAKDDPRAKIACERIREQIDTLLKDAPTKLNITLDPLAPDELYRRVCVEARFDLAYMPFDYPDDWHPLGLSAFLDSAAHERGGRNYCGYLAPNANADLDDRRLGTELQALQQHRDFSGHLVPRGAEIHKLFDECMPFVPLWQLDRLMLVHNNLRIHLEEGGRDSSAEVLNPTVLFQGVARWRVITPGGG